MTHSCSPADAPQRDRGRRQILTAQVRLLYSNANVGVGITLIATVILGRLQWGVVPHPIILGWCLYMFLVSVGRFTLGRLYRVTARSNLETSRWGAAFTIGAGLAGAGWGAAGILLYQEAHLANQVLLVFILGGMMLGAASVLAPRPEAFLAFIVPTGLAPAVSLAVRGDEAHVAMGLMASLFTLATLFTTRQIHLTIVSSLNLQFERQGAEAILRESEERFRLAVQATNDAVWDIDLATGTVSWNETYATLYGRPPETSKSWQWWIDRIHPEDRERTSDGLRSAISGNESTWTCEYRFQRVDGAWAYIYDRAYIARDPSGSARRVIGAMQDLTQSKRAEAELRESQQRLVSIYNTVEDIIFHLAIEPEGQFRIVSVNAAFLRVTGLSREKVVGKTVNEVIPEPSLTMVLGKYRQAIEEGTVVRWEETSDYPAGRLTGEVSIAPVFDNTGTCTHLVGSVHDITEVKRAQEIEKRLVADLAAGRDEIRALAASLMKAQEDERRRVSRELHDQICHQLASLAIDIGNLAEGPLVPENLQAHLTAVRARVVRTSQETHHIAYQMHTAILDDLGLVASLNALCRQFPDQYPNIAVDFKNSGPHTSIPREVATCLYRVAQASLHNVAKHSGAKNVSVRLGFKKGAAVLAIEDDGAGFDPKALKGRGGIGLISMEERARLVKGKLTITAAPGHGAQIFLAIPLQVDNSRTPRP